MSRVRPAVLAGALVGTLCFLPGVQADDRRSANEPSRLPVGYTLTSDPAREVLRLDAFSDGLGGSDFPRYSLYPDGRLVRERRGPASDVPTAVDQVFVSPEEAAALLDPLIGAGLAETSSTRLDSKRGGPFRVKDGVVYILELRLETYTNAEGEVVRDLEQRLEVDSPVWQLREFPHLTELREIIALREKLDSKFANRDAADK